MSKEMSLAQKKARVEELEKELELVNYSLNRLKVSGALQHISLIKLDHKDPVSREYHENVNRREEIQDELDKIIVKISGRDKYNLRDLLESGETLLISQEAMEMQPELKNRVRYSGYRMAEYERKDKGRNIRFKMKKKKNAVAFWFERGE